MRVVGGKVRLEEKIASGGMGDVYRGKQLVTGATVAVKILEPRTKRDDDAVERFRMEARVSALLAHRSIVRVFDLFEEPDGSMALVMEFLAGQTLEHRIAREGALDPVVAIAMIVPVLGALDHAHAVGVVHRDVKPANIFLAVEPDGRVTPKLLDFGVAKSSAANVNTMDGRVLGTASYVSPEQARAETVNGRSDIFSVGVVLYEAITGTSAFAGAHPAATMKNVLEATVDPHERIPPRVWLVIEKAIAKSAYERQATAGELARALENACNKTEDELASMLRDERPPLPKLETDVAIRSASPKKSVRVWPRALAFALSFGLGAALVASLVSRRTPSVPAPTTSIATSTPGAATPSFTASASPSIAPSATAAPTHAPTHAHQKPIATTPGF